VFVFVVFQDMGNNEDFTNAFSTVPAEIATGHDIVTPDRRMRDPETGQIVVVPGIRPTPVSVYITSSRRCSCTAASPTFSATCSPVDLPATTSRFIGARQLPGLLFGLRRPLVFGAGFLRNALEGVNSEDAMVPCLGASGAISGVLGGYILMFPTRRVLVLLFRVLVWVPAYVAIGICSRSRSSAAWACSGAAATRGVCSPRRRFRCWAGAGQGVCRGRIGRGARTCALGALAGREKY